MLLYFALPNVGLTINYVLYATLKYAPVLGRKSFSSGRRKFNVTLFADGSFVSRFTDHVVQLVESRWCNAIDGLVQRTVIKECLLQVSGELLGWSSRRQPNWFIAAASTLRPLFDKRNRLFSLWLRFGRHDDQQRYLTQRWCVAIAVRTCKNQWFQDMASSVQIALVQGNPNVVWRGIRTYCQCIAGLQPVWSRAIHEWNGSFCIGPIKTLDRWCEHFKGVLNVENSFNQTMIDNMQQYPLQSTLADPPCKGETLRALGRLSVSKAGGNNGLLPDLIKCCGGLLMDFIETLFATVWREQHVPTEWRNALLVPVPKKGDLSLCDNWRDISLLDLMGKLFARVINDRLQLVVEKVASDSQCGFQAGRGCVDLICVCQLMEKAIKHNTKVFLLFVDFCKAYDSVPRQALWCALRKYRILENLIALVRSFHERMLATVTVCGEKSSPFSVMNGLRQGCTIAPTLLYCI